MGLPRAPFSFRLPGGRRLAWYAFGAPAGRPVFYFHGFPGSGVEAAWGAAAASAAGIRLLGIDRPGFGQSEPHPGRTIDSLVPDVLALADHLGIDRFGVLGMSGGAPYALASVALASARVDIAIVVSGMGPLLDGRAEPGMTLINRFGIWLAARAPLLLTPVASVVSAVPRYAPRSVVSHLCRVTNDEDRILLQGELGALLAESFQRSVRHGADGLRSEASLFARPWGAWLPRITAPVHLLHGLQDHIVPVSVARRVEASIPGCRSRYFPDGGHFSVMGHHTAEVLDILRDV